MNCVQQTATGVYSDAPCTADGALIIMTAAEWADNASPFAIPLEQSGPLGGALLLVMTIAFIFRQAINLLNSSSKDES